MPERSPLRLPPEYAPPALCGRLLVGVLSATAAAADPPYLSRDGQLLLAERGESGVIFDWSRPLGGSD